MIADDAAPRYTDEGIVDLLRKVSGHFESSSTFLVSSLNSYVTLVVALRSLSLSLSLCRQVLLLSSG